MYTSLAVKYRPTKFEDVVEQSITTKILEKVIEKGKPKNAYLFAGDSGTGKTTLARIFANSINQGVGEPIEIDAASNNGVNQVRAIVESANERALVGTYKIFIIDECHAITGDGWRAFLKGIEEPSPYTIYIFCTTEPNKIPSTILNRVQRYNFSKISNTGIKSRLVQICQAEGFTNYEDTCELISKISQGCMRDAITYLDQCADYSTDLSLENTKQILGDVDVETMLRLTNAIYNGDEAKVLNILDKLYNGGHDLKQFVSAYLDFIIDLTKYSIFKDIRLTAIPAYLEKVQDQDINVVYTAGINLDWLNGFMDHILKLKTEIKYDTSYKATTEVYLLKACRG